MRIWLSLAAAVLLLFVTAIPAAALNEVYRFDDFGMSIKAPKGYHVITRETPADDPVFVSLQRSYQEMISEFQKENIYLCAYDPDWTFQIRLKLNRDEYSRTIGNYADLSDAELRTTSDAALASGTEVNKVRRGEYVFFESTMEDNSGEEPLYIQRCQTIANGTQIDLTLRKTGEPISASDVKALIAMASSIEFDAAEEQSKFEVNWWRILLWASILIALTLVLSIGARHRSSARRRRIEERRRKRIDDETQTDSPDTVMVGEAAVPFAEALGYRDADRFRARVGTDLESFDINVREKDPTLGVNYFEDGGKSIDDRSEDYFDNYFKEPTPSRSGIARLFATIGAYIGIGFRHVGYFFRNLWNSLFRRNKKQP